MLVKHFVLLFGSMIITSIILYYMHSHAVYALSPSFARQEIVDPPDDLTILKSRSDITTVIQTSTGAKAPIEFENNPSECALTQQQYDTLPPEISSVTYLSDGKTLNATLWLARPFIPEPLPSNDTLSPPFNGMHLYMVRYGMTLELSSIYHKPGADYTTRYQWDAINKTWDRVLEEIAPVSSAVEETRLLEQNHNDTAFYSKGKSYVNLSIDLHELNYPVQYSLFFYSLNEYIKGGRLCRIIDVDGKVFVPPPDYSMSTSPNLVLLRPGDEKTIELQIKSYTNVRSHVFLSTNQTDNGLTLNFIPNELFVPPNGIASSLIDIHALAKAQLHSYTLPIVVNISSPTEIMTRRSSITGEILYDPTSVSIVRNSNLTITVLPPQYNMSVLQSSLELRPGDEKDIRIEIRSNTNLDSNAFLSLEQFSPLKLAFRQNQIYIPSLGFVTSTLHVKAPENITSTTAQQYPIHILAKIFVIKPGVNVVNVNKLHDLVLQSVATGSDLAITVLPHLTFEERLDNFYTIWLSPVSGIWTFLAGVGAVIAPLIIRKKHRKRKRM